MHTGNAILGSDERPSTPDSPATGTTLEPHDPGAKQSAAATAQAATTSDYGLPPVLSASDAANFLGVNVKTLYDAIESSDLPARRVGKRRLVILRDALLAWLAQGRVSPEGDDT